MKEKIYIKREFKDSLQSIGCGLIDDYITVTRTEGNKVFFEAGSCKLHLLKDELEGVRADTEE